METPITPLTVATPFGEIPNVAIYFDGSGKAAEYFEGAMRTISERQAVLRIKTAFIEKHRNTLAGLYFHVGYLDPEIEIHHGYYRGKPASPKEIAKLWKGCVWRRGKEKFGDDTLIHYETELDGIKLIIKAAERIKPRPLPSVGGVVNLND